MLFDGGVGPLFKVLEVCIGEVAWLAEPTRGRTTRPARALPQRGCIVAKFASGCYSVALMTQ